MFSQSDGILIKHVYQEWNIVRLMESLNFFTLLYIFSSSIPLSLFSWWHIYIKVPSF